MEASEHVKVMEAYSCALTQEIQQCQPSFLERWLLLDSCSMAIIINSAALLHDIHARHVVHEPQFGGLIHRFSCSAS